MTDWLLAITTACYVIVSFFMWQAMQDSNEIAGRSWVLVKGVGVADIRSGVKIAATAALQNYGKAPATDVAVTGWGVIVKAVPEKTVELGNWPEGRPIKAVLGAAVIAPGEPAVHQFDIGPFKDIDVHEWHAGSKLLMITGAFFTPISSGESATLNIASR